MASRNVYIYETKFLLTSSLYIYFLNPLLFPPRLIIYTISLPQIFLRLEFKAYLHRIGAEFEEFSLDYAHYRGHTWPIRGKSRAVSGRSVGRSPRSNYAPCISFLARSRDRKMRAVSPGSPSFATVVSRVCAGKKRYQAPIRYRVLHPKGYYSVLPRRKSPSSYIYIYIFSSIYTHTYIRKLIFIAISLLKRTKIENDTSIFRRSSRYRSRKNFI